ncbi:hypothetical protein [Acinetobacter sp. ASP199]|uniref:hypothetical protein n=1 Tax=unclassified Acinetobacter TaxID=196816 RepID=UPI001F609D3A|nr:hypothetical protein [Acinetobacter sp. ASP199]UNT58017.1 hypothetical protein IHE35_07605 [Acinetobacter sp. ASP199]
MFKSILLGSFCFIALSACGGESDSSTPQDEKITTKEQVFQKLEDEGKLPKLERTDSILGIDQDQNGIRDDIDAYIKEKYKDELQKKAVQQFARVSQLKLAVNLEDEVALQASSHEADRAMTCVYKTFKSEPNIDASDVVDEIDNMTTNTKKRLQAYYKYSDALDGFVFTIPQRDYCDE